MNKRTLRMMTEMTLAGIIAFVLAYFSQSLANQIGGFDLALVLIPLVWLALRHGSASAILVAALIGLVDGLVKVGMSDFLVLIGQYVAPLLAVGLAGLFAKYSQKTLNNKRYSSTYLNIYTGTLLAVLVYFVIKQVLMPLALGEGIAFDWLSALLAWLVIATLIALFARLNPDFLIPKRSKYLSRKETSSLLND